ncbi:MAG: type III pantothenate kinase [Saprospiraceae bacterium]
MLVAIDIGNSNVSLAINKNNDWIHFWRYPTIRDESPFFYTLKIKNDLLENDIDVEEVEKIVLSSVVPSLTPVFKEILPEIFPVPMVVVGPNIYPYISLQIDNPNEIGSDLVANAVAANAIYKKDCIVVDFGTALTFTTVSKKGEVLGVAIAPGLKTAIAALFSKTAQLPEVPLNLPKTPVGKNTIHAIQSGILVGYVGLVKHMLAEIRKEVGKQYIAVATGGLSSILHPLKEEFEEIDVELTMNGLKIIAEAN